MVNNQKIKKSGMNKEKSDREIALEIIFGVMEKGDFSHIALRSSFEKYIHLDKTSRNFITRLSEGTIEKTINLDYIINFYSKVKVNKMKPLIRNILRMSVYQIKYMSGTPDSAVCNEAVKLTKKKGFTNLSGFINGVLRNIIRFPEKVVYPSSQENGKDYIKYLSVHYSMPEWIVGLFLNSYGNSITISILEGTMEAAENKNTTVRVNVSRINTLEAEGILKKDGVDVESTNLANHALQISGYNNITTLDAFKKGYIQVQNISSILVGQVAQVKKGDICIDVCAAPGGKSLHLADMLSETGMVISRDISEKKCSLIRENLQRIGFQNMKVEVCDALEFDEKSVETADLVVADLPCSGLGVMAKKPDIKYRLQEEELMKLSNLSQKILNNVVKYIKYGGTLIFSTCTMNPLENTSIRDWLMKEHHLVPVDISLNLSKEVLNLYNNKKTASEGYIQLFTSKDVDGFFISKFRRI